MKKLIHFARKQRQLKFKRKTNRRFILAFLAMFGVQQLSAQQLQFAPPKDDPYGIYNNFYDHDTITKTQFYEQLLDFDDDGDKDLLILDLEAGYYLGDQKLYYQENTINENGRFSDTFGIEIPNNYSALGSNYFMTFYFRFSNGFFADFDEDGDYDLYNSSYYSLSVDETVNKIYGYENTSDLSKVLDINNDYYLDLWNCNFSLYDNGKPCIQYFEIGDLNNDSFDDILVCNSSSFGGLGDSSNYTSFQFYKNEGLENLNPFYEKVTNPYNLDVIASKLNENGIIRVERVFLEDLDNNGLNELLLLTINSINFDKKLEVFYFNSIDETYEPSNSQVIWNKPMYSLYPPSYSVPYPVTKFFFVDMDNDGDLDFYEHGLFAKLDSSNSYYDYTTNQQVFQYYENTSTITSVDKSLQNQLSISPNPMSNQSLIRFENKQHQKAIIKVFDAMGRQIQAYQTYEKELNLTRKDLSSGIYTIQVKVADDFFNGKLVVE